MRMVSLLNIVGTCWCHRSSGEVGNFQTSTIDEWSMTVQEVWPRGNIYNTFAITDPWYLKCYELRTHGPKFLQLFWTNTWGQVCYKFQMFHALSSTLPLWTREFAWHRRTGMDKNLVKHRTQLRSRGVELVKVGELIHWKHMHST